MCTDHIETFRSSLRGVATLHETAADDAAATVADLVEEPAVGTPLPFAGVSLPDTVETTLSPSTVESARTGVTATGHAIASYGTVTIPTDSDGTELVSLYVSRHVAVLAASAVLPDMRTAYEQFDDDIADGADTQILATGPSATADMGTLVEGVHGPDEVEVVLLEDR
jgi:L-lactate dehydrogenase complex protein LldG